MAIFESKQNDNVVAVVGAGAAGIAAARALSAAGVQVHLLEARARIGGRAWTRSVDGYAMDMGCGWVHSANKNPWIEIAAQLGFSIDRTKPLWERQSGNQGMSPEDQKELARTFNDFNKKMRTTPLAADRSAASLLEPGDRWNLLLNAISTYFNGVRLEEVSLLDYRAYEDTEVNWRIVEGYGAVVEAFARDLPVSCSCVVERIVHSGPRVRVETSLGALTVDKVIVTVSSDVLANELIRFEPGLPEKVESAGNLPLGLVNKAFFYCDIPLPKDGHLFGNMQTMDTGSYHLRPFGRPLIEAFFAGELARNLAREGYGGVASFGIEELVSILGSDVRKALRPVAASSWGEEPYIRGSYSHARIGYSAARDMLGNDVDGRIFFAGEATSGKWFSTAHGAYMSGVETARRILGAHAPGTMDVGNRSSHVPTAPLKH